MPAAGNKAAADEYDVGVHVRARELSYWIEQQYLGFDRLNPRRRFIRETRAPCKRELRSSNQFRDFLKPLRMARCDQEPRFSQAGTPPRFAKCIQQHRFFALCGASGYDQWRALA